MTYNHKDAVALAFDANKKRLRLEARLVCDVLINEALAEMSREFTDALQRGEILHVGGTREEMIEFLRRAAQRQLGVGA